MRKRRRKAGTTLTKRIAVVVAGLSATGTLIAWGAGGVGARPSSTGKRDSGTAYASTNRTVGNFGYGSATATDQVLGATAITFKYTLTPAGGGALNFVSKHAVLYTRTGSIAGRLSATLTISGTTETFKNGKINLTSGAGSQKHHSLVGTFSGSGSSTTNEFKLKYKGTYK
jgi:hypothetical protein